MGQGTAELKSGIKSGVTLLEIYFSVIILLLFLVLSQDEKHFGSLMKMI